MSEKIWMVGGTTGEYSDRSEWVVDAWRSEEEAQARVTHLNTRMLELGMNTKKFRYSPAYEKAMEEMRKTDIAFQNDYTGTEYYICELELKP